MKEDFVLNLIEVQDGNPVIQGEDFDFLDNDDAQDWIEINGAYDFEEGQLDITSVLKWNSNDLSLTRKRKRARSAILTKRAIRKRKQKNREMAQNCKKVTEYFQPYKKCTVEISEDEEQSEESEEEQDVESSMIRAAIGKVSLTLVPVLNAKSDIAKIVSYMILRLMA
ncbi:hypothetical protein A0J61_11962, partial [Choanephora cucurbitarum]